MNLLNIIDKIYSSSYFTTVLIGAIVLLIILFVIVLIMGIRDSKKITEEPKEEEEVKDITLKPLDEMTPVEVNEDVTFEVPSITKNLEDFKKNLELELQKENNPIPLEKSNKPFKVTEVNELEDTILMNPLTDPKEEVLQITKELEKVNIEKENSSSNEKTKDSNNMFVSSKDIEQPKAPTISMEKQTEPKKENISRKEEPINKAPLLDENKYEEIRKIYLNNSNKQKNDEKSSMDETLELPTLKS